MAQVKDIAKYVRSKNAGPFWVTIDLFCDDQESFDRLCGASALAADEIATLYGVSAERIRIFQVAPLKVIKISFPRPVVQGSASDVDSHAGQYFVPLLRVVIPDKES
jgi:hypothetical protein